MGLFTGIFKDPRKKPIVEFLKKFELCDEYVYFLHNQGLPISKYDMNDIFYLFRDLRAYFYRLTCRMLEEHFNDSCIYPPVDYKYTKENFTELINWLNNVDPWDTFASYYTDEPNEQMFDNFEKFADIVIRVYHLWVN